MPSAIDSSGRLEPNSDGGRLIRRNGRLAAVSATGRRVTDREIREAIDAGRR